MDFILGAYNQDRLRVACNCWSDVSSAYLAQDRHEVRGSVELVLAWRGGVMDQHPGLRGGSIGLTKGHRNFSIYSENYNILITDRTCNSIILSIPFP